MGGADTIPTRPGTANFTLNREKNRFLSEVSSGQWLQAFTDLNGLSMTEILSALAQLDPVVLGELMKRTMLCGVGVNMPRIAYAATVVRESRLPQVAPGDLQSTGQVDAAKQFLSKRNQQRRAASRAPEGARAGVPIASADAAATFAIAEILPTSIANNWEYAGRILEIAGKGYVYTRAQTLKLDHHSFPGPLPPNYGNAGTYHTHAGAFLDTDEEFSPDDKLKATLGREIAYLGTPRGRILRFTPINRLSDAEQKQFPLGKVKVIRQLDGTCG